MPGLPVSPVFKRILQTRATNAPYFFCSTENPFLLFFCSPQRTIYYSFQGPSTLRKPPPSRKAYKPATRLLFKTHKPATILLPRTKDPGPRTPRTQGAHITLQSSGQDLVAQKGLSCEISIHTPPLGFKNVHASPVLIFPLANGSLFSISFPPQRPCTQYSNSGPIDCTVLCTPWNQDQDQDQPQDRGQHQGHQL